MPIDGPTPKHPAPQAHPAFQAHPATRAHPPAPPSRIIRAEAAALTELAARLDGALRDAFAATVALLAATLDAGRPLILTGIGKSGLIAQKIAATLRSTGAPAHFLHPTEALHGDLGMLLPRTANESPDTLLALSASGETAELLALLPSLARLNVQIVALTGCLTSTLARAAALVLDTSISEEACPHNLAPTTSTTVMLALGDALALTLAEHRGFAPEHFADLHPAGRLGNRLTRVRDLMHTGDDLPIVAPTTLLPDVIYEMSRKKLGLTTVCAPARHLRGIISDGDLRRMLGREGARSLALSAADIMNPNPHTIPAGSFAVDALALMEARSITALLVTNPIGEVEGVVHLHDLWKLNLP